MTVSLYLLIPVIHPYFFKKVKNVSHLYVHTHIIYNLIYIIYVIYFVCITLSSTIVFPVLLMLHWVIELQLLFLMFNPPDIHSVVRVLIIPFVLKVRKNTRCDAVYL